MLGEKKGSSLKFLVYNEEEAIGESSDPLILFVIFFVFIREILDAMSMQMESFTKVTNLV